MADGPIIQGKDGLLEWSAPIDYGSVVFHGGGLFPNAGTFYHDASVRKNNGTLIAGPTWQWVPELQRWGLSFLFTSSQYIVSPSANLSLPITMTCWCSLATSATSRVLMSLHPTTGASFDYYSLRINTLTPNILSLNGGVGKQSDAGNVTLNTWTHLAGVISSTTDRQCYKDGVPGVANTDAVAEFSVNQLGISTRYNDNTNTHGLYFDGKISDAMMWNRALSPAEIAWLANPANNPWQPWRRKSWAVTGAPPAVTTRNLILGGGVI